MEADLTRHNKISWILAAVMALLPFARLLIPVGASRVVFYYSLGILGIILAYLLVLSRKRIRIDRLTFCFLCVCAMSVCFSVNHEKFMAWQRLFAFTLMILVVGPLIHSKVSNNVRRKALPIMGWMCVVCALYYNGLYSFMVIEYCSWLSPYAWVFSHALDISMLFATFSAFGALYVGWLLLKDAWPIARDFKGNNRKAWMKCLWHICCFLLCFNSLIIASSRSALIAFAIGLLAMCILRWIRLKRIQLVGCAGASVILAFCTLTVIVPMTPGMEIKLNNVAKHDDYLASRRDLWNERGNEIQRFRLFGTGFGCVDEQSLNSYRLPISNQGTNIFAVKPADGVIEPGSSWMYVLSSTGILGFALFLLMVVFAFASSLRRCPLIPALLLFFTLHMIVEGYVLSAGSAASYIFWLTMAIALSHPTDIKRLLTCTRKRESI